MEIQTDALKFFTTTCFVGVALFTTYYLTILIKDIIKDLHYLHKAKKARAQKKHYGHRDE